MKPVFVVGVLFLGIFAIAQDQTGAPEFKKRSPKIVKTSSVPVNHAEASKTLAKVWNSLTKALKITGSNPVKLPNDSKPITKEEVLTAFNSIVKQSEAKFKRSASPVAFKASAFRKDMNPAYAKLVKDGFVMPVGPLVTGANGSVSTYEFGDAVGVLLVRIADLAHMPSRKFSPMLMKG